MSKETKHGIALEGAAGALGRKRLPRAGLGVFNRPSLPPPPCPVQVTRHSACHTGCSTSRLCRSTSCCAASAQLGGCWTSQESEYRNGCLGEGGNAPPGLSAQRVPPPSCPRSRDFYHTCYCLSGLAIAQHFGSGDLHHELVLGIPENRLVGWGGWEEIGDSHFGAFSGSKCFVLHSGSGPRIQSTTLCRKKW